MMRRLGVAASAALLASCAVGPDFKQPVPPSDDSYGSAPQQGQTAASEGQGGAAQRFVAGMEIPQQWWQLFQSPQLNALVEQSLKGNADLGAAQAALRQSHELYLASRASLFPVVGGNFSATRAKNPDQSISNPTADPNATFYNLYTAQLTLSYAPDVFGGGRRALEAAQAQAQASRWQYEATYLTLSSNVVVTAVQEASLRDQVSTTERLLEIQHHLTETLQKQRGLGTVSNLDVLAQQAAEAQTAQSLPPLRKQLGQTRDALTALLGRLPAQEPAETFTLDDLTLPADLPVSLPSKLVAQRPDVRQAQENLHAASAEVGVAIANELPQFAITGGWGSTANKIGDLFSPYTGFWSIGGSLTQTLFDAGALLHQRRAADAALDQAAEQYRAAVILACQNVADSLRALQADADALKAGTEAERAAKASFDLAQKQRKLGTVSMTAVLNAEQAWRQAGVTLVQARASRYADTAALFQALGGGWWNRPQDHDQGQAEHAQTGLAGR